MNDYEEEDLRDRLKESTTDLISISKVSRIETLKWFERLLTEKKDCVIVYRPHPGENIDMSLKFLTEKYNNFRIIQEESVKQWIIIADSIFTWRSTAIVEVMYAQRKCLILRPVKIPDRFEIEIFKNSVMINTYEELMKTIEDDDYAYPIDKRIIDEYYNNSDGYAYIKITDILIDVLNNNNYIMPTLNMRYKIEAIRKWFHRFIKLGIKTSGINSQTWLVKNNRRISNYLDHFYYFQNKISVEQVDNEEIKRITEKYRNIIEKD